MVSGRSELRIRSAACVSSAIDRHHRQGWSQTPPHLHASPTPSGSATVQIGERLPTTPSPLARASARSPVRLLGPVLGLFLVAAVVVPAFAASTIGTGLRLYMIPLLAAWSTTSYFVNLPRRT